MNKNMKSEDDESLFMFFLKKFYKFPYLCYSRIVRKFKKMSDNILKLIY